MPDRHSALLCVFLEILRRDEVRNFWLPSACGPQFRVDISLTTQQGGWEGAQQESRWPPFFSTCRIEVERRRGQVLDREFRPNFDLGSRKFREMGPLRNCAFIAARALTRIGARIPSRPPDGGRNEKIANVTLAEGALDDHCRNHSRPIGADGTEIYRLHLTDWREPGISLLRLATALPPGDRLNHYPHLPIA